MNTTIHGKVERETAKAILINASEGLLGHSVWLPKSQIVANLPGSPSGNQIVITEHIARVKAEELGIDDAQIAFWLEDEKVNTTTHDDDDPTCGCRICTRDREVEAEDDEINNYVEDAQRRIK